MYARAAVPESTSSPRRRRRAESPISTRASTRSRSTETVQIGQEERNYVFAVAMKYVKDEEAANDVAQDALLLVHRHRDSFRGASRFTTWLYRVAATTALMHLRKSKRRSREVLVPQRVSDEGQEPGWDPCDPSTGPCEELENRQALEAVCERLDELGSKYRDIFWMRFLEGYTESEIAKELGLNLTTVKTRAYRARLAVREHLEAQQAA